jgi:hypothetical protein
VRRRNLAISGTFGLFLALSAVACGSESEGAAAAENEPPSGPNLPSGEPKAPPVETPICAESTGQYTATREPSNVLFLYDRSGSMHIQLPSNATRWDAMKDGFFSLIGSLPSTTSAGLMLFPQGDDPVNTYCGVDPSDNDVHCTAGWPEPAGTKRCDVATYEPDVASALLSSSQVQSIKDKLTASDPGFYWGTPLATAVRAAIASQKASKLPGAKSIILLTDGNPTSCTDSGITNDISNVTEAAAEGLQGTLVRTFVVGLTDSSRQAAKAENLSPIAVAGGTKRSATCETDNSCFYKLTDANFASDLKKIFEEISLQAFDCTFNLPPQSSDTDPSLINVQLTDGSGAHTVARDAGHANGWDYLPNGTQIQLYGQACTDMKDDAAKLKIVLGCKTVTPEPPPPDEQK